MFRAVFLLSSFSALALAAPLGVQRVEFPGTGTSHYLLIEILGDDLAHFEVSGYGKSPGTGQPIYVSPMVDRASYRAYAGPSEFRRHGNTIETLAMRIRIETDEQGDRCVRMEDRARGVYLTRVCAKDLAHPDVQRLTLDRGEMQNAYGIGNLFVDPITADGDWVGRMWQGRNHGNFRFGPHWFNDQAAGSDDFDGGGPSVSQLPILYATGRQLGPDQFQNYALFLDHVYKLSWFFNEPQRWTAQSYGDQFRWFFFVGPNLRGLRASFLNLVGRPPIPPKNVFGLWISKFGYDSWGEIRTDLDGLRRNRFPFDGVALDLQWFGGRFDEPQAEPRMGKLWFNTHEGAFPNPEREVPRLRRQYGIRLMPIEESYVDSRIPEYHLMSRDVQRCYLASLSDERCQPISLTRDIKGQQDIFVWWGRGGMIDWSNADGARFWFDSKRLPLARLGIYSHWLDLGEPEMYYEYARYHGVDDIGKRQHGDIHNLYNLLWAKSIDDGYRDPVHQAELAADLGADLGQHFDYGPRHFTMSRAGTVGSQRYGAMWSGDVGRNTGNLRAHLNTQLHMSLAGLDYYGSDAGGFLGTSVGLEPGFNENELYTQWFADNSLTDIPLRPHAWALDKQLHFTPDRRGDPESNRFHVRQRYELTPYIYSLAHRAYRFGEPIFPPPVYYFQGDLNLRDKGNMKMMGPWLYFGAVAGFGQQSRRVYLPRGSWVNYNHPEQWFLSHGEETPEIPLYVNEHGHRIFQLPLFARAGAIIPKMHVDDDTRNVSGRRAVDENSSADEATREHDHALRDELVLRVVASPTPSHFTLYEDDGLTLGYEHGQLRTVRLGQQQDGLIETVTIGAAAGHDFPGAVARRATVVELMTEGLRTEVVDSSPPCRRGEIDFAAGETCWFQAAPGLVKARFPQADVRREQRLTFRMLSGN